MWNDKGYRTGINSIKVTYLIKGLNLDRLINTVRKKGITLYNVKKYGNKRLIVSVSLKESKNFFAITKELCYNIKKVREKGVLYPFLWLYRSLGVLIGSIIIISFACYFDGVIVSVDYSGSGRIYKSQVEEYLIENGVKKFARFSNFNLNTLADGILSSNPHLSFASCEKRGTTLKVELILSQDKVDRLNGNEKRLLSTADGIVESIKVYRGTALCSVGQTVKTGDILVDGYAEIKDRRVETNVIAVVSVISERTFRLVFDGDDLEERAVLLAEQELGEVTVLEEKIQKEKVYDEFLYVVTLKYRSVMQVG